MTEIAPRHLGRLGKQKATARVLVTNMAMMRNWRYHGGEDLPDTLDYPRMAKVVQGLQGVLLIADRE